MILNKDTMLKYFDIDTCMDILEYDLDKLDLIEELNKFNKGVETEEKPKISIDFNDLIGQKFFDLNDDVVNKNHLTYILKSGRGSLKGSFVYLSTIAELQEDALNGNITHCVALRKVKDTIRDSVFTNLIWAINMLNLQNEWKYQLSPLKIWNSRTGNSILFRGCANQLDHKKIKSIKFEKGYGKILIFEESTEFAGIDEIDDIIQSVIRAGDEALIFMPYNPPASKSNWLNEHVRELQRLERDGVDTDTYIHHSTYEDIEEEKREKFLGKKFIEKAQQIKKINPKKYRHVYMGEETGEGLEIYPPFDPKTEEGVLVLREITNKEMSNFAHIYRGLDFGYSHATCYSECFYDFNTMTVYIFGEVYKYKASNKTLIRAIKPAAKGFLITADSEDPRTINEFNKAGLNVIGAKKGPDSKDHGINWLRGQYQIIIDPKRCPEIASDFQNYEYEKDKKTGQIIYEFPDEPDGSASIRYGLERIMMQSNWEFF